MRPCTTLCMIMLSLTVVACGGDRGNTITGSDNFMHAPAGSVSCGSTRAIFSASPVALTDVIGWVPLGQMGPPGHTFPTDHQYLYVSNPNGGAPRREVNIVAPRDMYITTAHRGTTTPGGTDYTLEFSACLEVYGQFGHVLTIAPDILAQLGAFDQYCNVYAPAPNASVSTCATRPAAIKVQAGQIIGTGGGDVPHSLALDMSLWDARVPATVFANPARWQTSSDKIDQFHVVPASEYFIEPLATQVRARVGSYDGATLRVAAPSGGTVAVDVVGSMQGFWFNASQPNNPEVPHLAIAPDNIDPSRMALSIGTSLIGWSRGLVLFTPVGAGVVNRNPSTITADGVTYCFEGAGAWVLIAQLTSATSLRLEMPAVQTSCAAAQPWGFTSAAFNYAR